MSRGFSIYFEKVFENKYIKTFLKKVVDNGSRKWYYNGAGELRRKVRKIK